MRAVVALGRLDAATEVSASDHGGFEQFVGPRMAERMPLLDGHHGRPLAHLIDHWRDHGSGMHYAEFQALRGREAEVRALLHKPLSIEFTSQRELEPDRGPGGRSVMVHRAATIHGVAAVAVGDEARDDCRMIQCDPLPETAREPVAAVRSRSSQAALLAEVERRHPKTASGLWTHPRGGSIIG